MVNYRARIMPKIRDLYKSPNPVITRVCVCANSGKQDGAARGGQTMADEEWRLIDGTEDYYISSRGRLKRGRKLRKLYTDPEGYVRCTVAGKKCRVHRLVAMAFIPNPDELPVIDHIDGVKSNNCVENLRWCTQKENTQAAYDTGLSKGSCVKDIMSVDTENNWRLYESQVAASKATGVDQKAISKVVRGIEKSRGGYRFFRCEDFVDLRED